MFDFKGGDPVTLRSHTLMELHERVLPYVIQASFDEISQLRHIHFDHTLIIVLVEQYRREMHTFHPHVGEMTPPLQDVAMLIGLPINKTPVTGRGGLIDRDTSCDCLLGWVPPTDAYRNDCIKLTWLDITFKTRQHM